MSRFLNAALIGISILALSAPTFATVLFTGGGSPTAVGYSFVGVGGGTASEMFTEDTPTAGILTQNNEVSDGGFWNLSSPGPELSRAVGWFAEARAMNFSDTGSSLRGLVLAEDEVGGVAIEWQPSQIRFSDAGATEVLVPVAADVFHTVRVSMAPGGTDFSLFVDGVSAGTFAGNLAIVGSDRFDFGDHATGGGAGIQWDYVGLNAVPEPASLCLIPLLAGMIRRPRCRA